MSHPDSKELESKELESKQHDSQESNPHDSSQGQLFVVATPIGNLADISQRALKTLANVDVILAEDTRHSKRLLNHYGVNTRLRSCHEYNETAQIEWVASALNSGQNLALISDAGTPLISDPGFVLVRALRERGFDVLTVPGPSSIIAALSIAGLPTNSFVYDGFLPAKNVARESALSAYLTEPRTVVLLESSHRIHACVLSIQNVLGSDRHIVIARELTKRFETVMSGSVDVVLNQIQADPDQTRGEFVVMIAGAAIEDKGDEITTNLMALLSVLIAELPVKQAAGLAAKIMGVRKNEAYTLAQQLKDQQKDQQKDPKNA